MKENKNESVREPKKWWVLRRKFMMEAIKPILTQFKK